MATVDSKIKFYKLRPGLRALFKNLVEKPNFEMAGALMYENGMAKSILPEHADALAALAKLEEAGLVDVVDRPVGYVEER